MRAISEFYFKDCTPTLFTRIFPPDTVFPKKFTVLMSQYVPTIGAMEQFAVVGHYYSETSMQLFQVARASYSTALSITINYTSGSRTLSISNVFSQGSNTIYVYVDYSQYPTCFVRVANPTSGVMYEGTTTLDSGKSFYNYITFVSVGITSRSTYVQTVQPFKYVVVLDELPIDWALLETTASDVVSYITNRPDAKDIISALITTKQDDNVDAFFADPALTTEAVFENLVVVPAIFVNEGELLQVGDVVVQTENPQLYVKTQDVKDFIRRGLRVSVDDEEYEVAYFTDEAGITKIELRKV